MLSDFDINSLQEVPVAKDAIVMLLNIVEDIKRENQLLKEENQRLKDEINRLRGEQGKPKIKPNKPDNDKPQKSTNHSSEEERSGHGEKWKKNPKLNRMAINEIKILSVDQRALPPDARFKGYVDVVVQDIIIKPHNIRFRKEKYHSPSEGKVYIADLPRDYQGEFGPGIKSLVITLYFQANVSQPKIIELLTDVGIIISTGQLSNFIIKKHETFHNEKNALYKAGIQSTPWQHIDDTTTRVNGKNKYCQIVCNPFYTAYFTTENKSRLNIIDVITNFSQRTYSLNQIAYDFLDKSRLSEKVTEKLKLLPQKRFLNEGQFTKLLDESLPKLGPQQRNRVFDAAAVAAYHTQTDFPIIRTLLCDDAPQFKDITEELSLCWVHDGRHYKKLTPFIAYHQQLITNFLERYWSFYHELLDYKKQPTNKLAESLETKFDDIFSTVTGYDALDERIAKTIAKKQSLLLVLKYPDMPLHNNPAELGARQRVRKRDVSFGTRKNEGTKAWDTFMTLAETAKKLGVSFYKFVYDRISEEHAMPSFSNLIDQRAKQFLLAVPNSNSS
jgi:hypothetical protein